MAKKKTTRKVARKTARTSTRKTTAKVEPRPPSVDEFLLALQKTLSRVSRDSAQVPTGQARSLIVGSVAFEVTLRCSLDVRQDRLLLTDEGGESLKLAGQIAADVGVKLDKEVDDGKA